MGVCMYHSVCVKVRNNFVELFCLFTFMWELRWCSGGKPLLAKPSFFLKRLS